MSESRFIRLSKSVFSKSQIDILLAFLLALGVYVLYVYTLAPSVLDGDQGENQYMPFVLGIPRPTGFPLYLILGHFWSYLPIGTIAYRMNLFSAVWGAATVGVIAYALRRQDLSRRAASVSALTLAVLPTFWQFSTMAATYTLHTFIGALLFAFLAHWEHTSDMRYLYLSFLVFGFGLANHPIFLLFAPATVIFLLLVRGSRLFAQRDFYLSILVSLTISITLYLYIPLRANQLIGNSVALPGWPLEKANGMISPLFPESQTGLFLYLTNQNFTRNMAGQWNWGELLSNLMTNISHSTDVPLLILASCGVIALAVNRVKIGAWLIVAFFTFGIVAFQYENTLVSAGDFAPFFEKFLLANLMILTILCAYGIDSLMRGAKNIVPHPAPALMSLALVFWLASSWINLAGRHTSDLHERSIELEQKWRTVQRFPPEKDAALVGHWGDLTPLWYFQYAKGWRKDLLTIHPPTDEQVGRWLENGKPLYLAGPLLGWAPGIAQRYHLTAWGPLVRVNTREYLPPSPLRDSVDFTFEEKEPRIRLMGYEVSPFSLHAGEVANLSLYWEYLADVSLDETLVFLSLVSPDNNVALDNYSIVVDWLPGRKLVTGQRGLGIYRYAIPKATPPGEYSLRLRIYSINDSQNLRVKVNGQIPDYIDLHKIRVE